MVLMGKQVPEASAVLKQRAKLEMQCREIELKLQRIELEKKVKDLDRKLSKSSSRSTGNLQPGALKPSNGYGAASPSSVRSVRSNRSGGVPPPSSVRSVRSQGRGGFGGALQNSNRQNNQSNEPGSPMDDRLVRLFETTLDKKYKREPRPSWQETGSKQLKSAKPSYKTDVMLSRNLECAIKRKQHGQPGASGCGGGPARQRAAKPRPSQQENSKPLFTSTTASRFQAMSKRRALPFSWENRDNMLTPGVAWIQDPEQVDLSDMFVVLWDGIAQDSQRENEIASVGLRKCVEEGLARGVSFVPVCQQLVPMVRKALFNAPSLMRAIKALTFTVRRMPDLGRAVVRFLPQLLSPLNKALCDTEARGTNNLGDDFDYGQKNLTEPAQIIMDCLEAFEACGGLTAYSHIKRLVPTYESTLQ